VAIGAPSALGALFDTASQVLRVLPSIRRSDLPRMADFAPSSARRQCCAALAGRSTATGASGSGYGRSPDSMCAICCGPLDSALARSGYHTHPGCDPWEEGP